MKGWSRWSLELSWRSPTTIKEQTPWNQESPSVCAPCVCLSLHHISSWLRLQNISNKHFESQQPLFFLAFPSWSAWEDQPSDPPNLGMTPPVEATRRDWSSDWWCPWSSRNHGAVCQSKNRMMELDPKQSSTAFVQPEFGERCLEVTP